jgi:hypothetical protein
VSCALPLLIAFIPLVLALAGTLAPGSSTKSPGDVHATAAVGQPSAALLEWEFDVSDKTWVAVELALDREGIASILWASKDAPGLRTEEFPIRGDGKPHFYNIPMVGIPAWRDHVVAFGIRLPKDAKARLNHIQIDSKPFGPGELEVTYFGFENGVSRAGRPCKLLVQVSNRGGSAQGIREVDLRASEGLSILSRPERPGHPGIEHGATAQFVWEVRADKPGSYPVYLSFSGKGGLPPQQQTILTFADPLSLAHAPYVPKPSPVQTDLEICAFYFPGWESNAKWDCIRKVAIMWANHNPPGTHSADDWLKLTGHWIDRCFPLPGYYRVNGKPAVFIWNPQGIRTDLGSSEAVRKVFDESQAMARNAGFGGITLIAMGPDFSESHVRALKEEGYFGVTTYHEWGSGIDGQVTQKLFSYEDVVHHSPEAWQKKNQTADGLVYYPLVDTGWDSRPWHGYRAMVIQDRTPRQFEELLRGARIFCKENGKGILILGPVNEWGEGSYIEPCTEFGFQMLEVIRRTFATGTSTDWPVNISPADVGLGPYDYAVRQP